MNSSIVEIVGIKGEKTAAINPRTVIGAIIGATKILAGTVIKESWLDSKTIIGVQNKVALTGIEIASTSHSCFI